MAVVLFLRKDIVIGNRHSPVNGRNTDDIMGIENRRRNKNYIFDLIIPVRNACSMAEKAFAGILFLLFQQLP